MVGKVALCSTIEDERSMTAFMEAFGKSSGVAGLIVKLIKFAELYIKMKYKS